jgi:hypothetical protein
MAMNEDSVVSSLNELRRMASDRARRETESRARVEERPGWDQRGHGRRPEGRLRATEIRGSSGGYQDAVAPDPRHTMTGGHAVAAQQPWHGEAQPQAGYGYGNGNYGYNHAAQPALPETYQEPVRQKSAAGPVLLTILIMGGLAAGGYWKLQQDWQATLRARDQALLATEQERNKAVELASRAEQLAKNQVAALTAEQAKAAPAKAEPAPTATAEPAAVAPTPASKPVAAAPTPAAKPAAAKPARAEKGKRGRRAAAAARRLAASRPAPVVAAPPVEEKKPAVMPKIAGKKKLNDDPLAGLKL